MKKIILVCLLFIIPILSRAADMGSYIDLMHSIEALKRSPDQANCKNEVINMSQEMIDASNQTMAEAIMFMLIESERNKKPIFCVPKNFDLSSSIIEKIMIEEYDRSSMPLEKKLKMPAAIFVVMGLHRKYHC